MLAHSLVVLSRAWRLVATLAAFVLAATVAVATDIDSGFSSKAATFETWNACQADPKSLTFESADGRDFMRDPIDGETADKACSESCEEGRVEHEADGLGRSLVFGDLKPLDAAKCPTPETDAKGKVIHQRNELRLNNSAGGCHKADAPHWYRIVFKIAENETDKIPACGSIRWVLAQWKYGAEPKPDVEVNDSPFLAQRFDNGVLHITVEDGFCRCMIAKSDGDPDAMTMKTESLREVAPLRCDQDCAPPRLKLYATNPALQSALPDPKKGWVEMTYRVSADASQGTQFDVYANGQFIVRAAGAWPGNIGFPNLIKFKFGHYRDKYDAKAGLLVDRVCISETKDDCAKDVVQPP